MALYLTAPMRTRAVFALLACFALSCTTEVKRVPGTATEQPQGGGAEETPKDPEPGETFGDAMDPNAPEIALTDLVAKAPAYVGKTVTTVGVVQAVCQKRGCWMEIGAEETSSSMRVTFYGYSFFVPRDSKGAEVKVQGKIAMTKLSPEDVQHLEAEGATIKKNADGSADLPVFTAKAVEMRRRVE